MSKLTKDEVYSLHIYRITQKEIAEKCGYAREYVADIVNGRYDSPIALVKIKTAIADIAKERRENIGHP